MPTGSEIKWIRVSPEIAKALGSYVALGIETAFNTGIAVEMPPIEGLSPIVKVRTVDLEEAISRISTDPTEDELARWKGMNPEEIRRDIEGYVRNYAAERGYEVK